jgi:hypothetical protein
VFPPIEIPNIPVVDVLDLPVINARPVIIPQPHAIPQLEINGFEELGELVDHIGMNCRQLECTIYEEEIVDPDNPDETKTIQKAITDIAG